MVEELKLPLSAEYELEQGSKLEIDIKLIDKRTITRKQQNFIFALIGEIAYYTGNESEWVRMLMQQFNANLREIEVESLKSCTMTYANGLIDTIITHMIENEIPFKKDLLDDNQYKFTEQQVYAMTLKRLCVVCGARAEIHHIDSIGMGNDRNKISHIGKKSLPLCRTHHAETHNIGNDKFIEKYHLKPIVIDEKLEYFIKKGKINYYKGE